MARHRSTSVFAGLCGLLCSSLGGCSLTPNLAPQANDQLVTGAFNTPNAIMLTANDPDSSPGALTYSIVSPPQHGTLTGTPPNVTYTPDTGYSGPDSFTFKANDGEADSNAATVAITVEPANDQATDGTDNTDGADGTNGTDGTNQPPTADNQSVNVNFETPTAITLTGSDPDSGPQALTYSIDSPPQHGTLTGAAPSVTYTPQAGFSGPDSFTFQVHDGLDDSSPATVSITVQSGDDGLILDLGGGVTLELVLIPAGTFQMGDLSGVGFAAEQPVHTVTISQAFYLGKYEVTQAQWEAVMGPFSFYFSGNNRPAEFVSWSDAQDFCLLVSTLSGRTARLPTEAEWEYACRAGSATDYFFSGDSSSLPSYAWYHDNSGSQTHAVGGKLPNDWGLYDMAGNVWEMCADWYGAYGSSAASDPTGPASGTQRVARGGAYGSAADASSELRCSARLQVDPTKPRGADAGFRIAIDAP